MKLIEKIRVKEENKINDNRQHIEKYWSNLLFASFYEMKIMADLYNNKRKGKEKKDLHDALCIRHI